MKLLVIVPDYPNDKSVAYQFVHDRVKDYKKYMEVDVFCLNNKFKESYTFENINVFGGNSKELKKYIDNNKIDIYSFFFIIRKNAKFILNYLKDKKVYVFFMGSDCVSCSRRFQKLNWKKNIIGNIKELIKRLIISIVYKYRISSIKRINEKVENVTFVFVSLWSKENSEIDFNIKYNNSVIINNKIDDTIFKYYPKKAEDRFKVLSIKSYAKPVYGNDILQDVIVEFSKYKEFKHFTFELYGDGILFDECTCKLKEFDNVKIYRKFLSHEETVEVQKKNGIFIYPKRGDSQGVSRCEAMISGLVPIASDVEAISEFSPSNTSYLVNTVDDFIKALLFVYNNPDDFLDKSLAGSNFIKEKCSYENTVKKEIELFLGRKI